MFTVQRGFYNSLTIADFTALTAYLGSTSVAGDVLLWRFSTRAYGTVNAANNAVVLATA